MMERHPAFVGLAVPVLLLAAALSTSAADHKPDLVPWAMGKVEATCYTSGSKTLKKFTLRPSVKNQGQWDAVMPPGWQLWVSAGAPGAVKAVQGGPPSVLKPGATAYFEVVLIVPVADKNAPKRIGSPTLPITITADPNNFIPETDEQNNTWVYKGQTWFCN
jgi:hypothetical protein